MSRGSIVVLLVILSLAFVPNVLADGDTSSTTTSSTTTSSTATPTTTGPPCTPYCSATTTSG